MISELTASKYKQFQFLTLSTHMWSKYLYYPWFFAFSLELKEETGYVVTDIM